MQHTLRFSLQSAVYFVMLLFWFKYHSHFTYRVCENLNVKFNVCKSVHHRTIQINHQPDATIFQFIILTFFTAQHVSGVFLPIIRSSVTTVAASGFTFVSWWQPCCVRGRAGRLKSFSSWWWAGKRPKYVELWTNVRIINWKIVASG